MRSPNLPYVFEGALAGEAPPYSLPEIGSVALLPHMANTESAAAAAAAQAERQRVAAQRVEDARAARNLEIAREIAARKNG